MRIILSILALFCIGTADAQQYNPSCGRELPRTPIRIYPTAAEASEAGREGNRYMSPLTTWENDGERMTATFTVPFAWINRQVFFRLEWVSRAYELWINGRKVGYDANSNAPAEYNITKYVEEGRNRVEIVAAESAHGALLESWKSSSQLEAGEAWVMSQPTLHVRDILSRTRIGEDGDATAEVGVVLRTGSLNPRTSRLYYTLLSPSGRTVTTGSREITLNMRREDTVRFLARIPYDSLWCDTMTRPYRLQLKTQHEGRYEEYLEQPLDFRTVEVREGHMSINGRKVALRCREVPGDYDPGKLRELRGEGYTTLRLLPGPVAKPLLDSCDRLGLYVIVQAPVDTRRSGDSRRVGGNPSNNPAWREAYVERALDSYHTTKLHPSVIAFALATQSANGINLYESYLKVKELHEERPFIYPDAEGEWNSDRLFVE